MMRLLFFATILLPQDSSPRKEASLGVETRAPTKAEAKEYDLPRAGKVQGQMVESLEAGSPAEKAGIGKGDVILKLNENKIYSRDAIEDFLRVTKPGTEVKALVKRAKTYKEEEVAVKLGERASKDKGIVWQYASLEQLEAALARAKKEEKFVLVGISGAET